jgi:hypothetical protein
MIDSAIRNRTKTPAANRTIFRDQPDLSIAPQERAHRDAMQIRFAIRERITANDRAPKPNREAGAPNVQGPKQPWYGVV